MTLQTSGAISLDQVRVEFGGDTVAGMNEYYAGGANVPAGTKRNWPANLDGRGINAAIPTSGQLSLADFYGASNYISLNVSVPNGSKWGFGSGDIALYLTSSVSGGNGSHTYSWTKISGSSYVNISGSTTGYRAYIKCTTPGSSGDVSAVFRCTVSDGTSSDYDNATASFSWEP